MPRKASFHIFHQKNQYSYNIYTEGGEALSQ